MGQLNLTASFILHTIWKLASLLPSEYGDQREL